MTEYHLGSGICLLLGVVLVFYSIKRLLETIVFLRTARRAPGRVVRHEPSSNSDGQRMFIPVFEYRLPEGRPLYYRSPVASNPPAYDVGQTVEMLYLPKNPARVKVNSFTGLWLVTAICAVLGVSLIGAAGMLLK